MDAHIYSDVAAPVVIAPEVLYQEAAVNSLIYKIFGPGRFVKTAERLREGNQRYADLSLVATQGQAVHGSVRLWPVTVTPEDSEAVEGIAFLGPITVDPAFQGSGIGSRLIKAAVEKAFAKGLKAVLLVGDYDYFKRFGFERAQGLTLPGPADPKRILIAYAPDAAHLTGKVSVPR